MKKAGPGWGRERKPKTGWCRGRSGTVTVRPWRGHGPCGLCGRPGACEEYDEVAATALGPAEDQGKAEARRGREIWLHIRTQTELVA